MKPTANTPHSRNNTASLYKTERSNESDEQINTQEDKAFSIEIYDKDISVPPFCTCCMKRCNRMVNLSGKVGRKVRSGSTESQNNYQFPLCEECETHRKELKKKRNLIYGL